MILKDELQYLHDKLTKVEQTQSLMLVLHSLRAYIKNGAINDGFRHDLQLHLGKCQEDARINRYKKDIHAQCKDIDIMYCANEFYYAVMLTLNAVGTKQEANVAKFQGQRIEKAKKVLDLL